MSLGYYDEHPGPRICLVALFLPLKQSCIFGWRRQNRKNPEPKNETASGQGSCWHINSSTSCISTFTVLAFTQMHFELYICNELEISTPNENRREMEVEGTIYFVVHWFSGLTPVLTKSCSFEPEADDNSVSLCKLGSACHLT